MNGGVRDEKVPDKEGRPTGCFLCAQHVSDRPKTRAVGMTTWTPQPCGWAAVQLLRKRVSEPCSEVRGRGAPQRQEGSEEGSRRTTTQRGQGHSLLFAVGEVQIHLELKIHLT